MRWLSSTLSVCWRMRRRALAGGPAAQPAFRKGDSHQQEELCESMFELSGSSLSHFTAVIAVGLEISRHAQLPRAAPPA